MLDRKDIIKIIKEIDLPFDEYWITSGAALVIHGVKKMTHDIDLGGTTNLVEHFIQNGCTFKIVEDNSRIVEVNNHIELLENWIVDDIELIDNLPVATLQSIKKQKFELGREKDIRDIKLIEEFLST